MSLKYTITATIPIHNLAPKTKTITTDALNKQINLGMFSNRKIK
jgi:hypothetical protein